VHRVSEKQVWSTRRLRSTRLAALALPVGLSLSQTAAADIVWEGRLVRAWPEVAPAPTPRGVARAESQTNFFPRPAGTIKALTLLVNFSDEAGAFTAEEIDDWLNAPGYSRFNCKGSVRDYYKDVSNGAVDLVNTVHAYYRAKNPKSYYEGGSGYERAGELMQELIAGVDAEVDFSEFDNDGDGRTEAISVVYGGPMVEWGQGLWPHAGALNQKRDGVTLSRYQMTSMGTSLSLYTFAHETGHMLFGWPDLYGFGDYCLMGNATNAANPAGINDFFRADQGWIPAVEVDASANASYTASLNGTGYLFVNPSNAKELFFWSNIQPEQRWSVLKGGGLLVLHYDGTIRGNEPPDPLQVAVVQADGKKDLDATMWPMPGSDTNDFFRSGAHSEFSSTTMPRSNWNNGNASGLRIHSISASGAEMTFAVGTGSAGAPPASGGSSSGGASSGGGNAGRGGVGSPGGASGSGGRASGGIAGSGGAALGGASGQGGTSVAGATSGSGGATGGASTPVSGGTSGNLGAGGSVSAGGIAGGGSSGARAGSMHGGGVTLGPSAPASGDSSSAESGCTTTGHARGAGAWFAVLGLAGVFAFARRRTRASRR
jgi:M6 family metalloprotease-like protein